MENCLEIFCGPQCENVNSSCNHKNKIQRQEFVICYFKTNRNDQSSKNPQLTKKAWLTETCAPQ